MATSGSSDFILNGREIVEGMMRKLGVLDEGETPTAEAMQNGLKTLNIMVKALMAKGLNLWKYAEVVLFLNTTSQSYALGLSGAHACLADDYAQMQLAAAASSGASAITVDDASDIASGDAIGIVQEDNTIHWTTVSGAPVGAVVTLAAPLTAAAAEDAQVHAYTSKPPRPLRVTSARMHMTDNSEPPVAVVSRSTYFSIPNKSSRASMVTQVYYDPQLGNGVVYAHPVSNTVNNTLRLTAQVPIEDFDALTDTPDFPQEWYEMLIYNLALREAPAYGISLSDPSGPGPDIEKGAVGTLEDVLGFDREATSVRFYPGNEDDEMDE